MSNVFDTSVSTQTSLPSWYTDAQKNAATSATNAFNAATAPGATVGANLVGGMGQDNYFTNAMNTLQGVASNNANPFMSSGQPNTNTPLGSLFAAQNANLNQMLPAITAREGAAGIGGGNFGSLRGQTATNTARAGALTTLAEQQNKAALDAQTQAIQAGQAIGNIGSQYNTAGLNLANWQMAGGLPTVAKYGDILGSMATTLPKTEEKVTSQGDYKNALSALGAVGALGSAGGFGATDLAKVLGGKTGISWLDNMVSGAGSSIPAGAIPSDPNAGYNTDFGYDMGSNNDIYVPPSNPFGG